MPFIDDKFSSDNTKKYGPKSTLAQTLVTLAQNFLSIGLGMGLSTPAIVIQNAYQNSASDFSISQTEASWYGSLMFIFHLLGALLSGTVQEKLGKKRCMMISNVPNLTGWILLYQSYSAIVLCASTSMIGFSIGFSSNAMNTYIGEISEPRLRGRLASSSGVAVVIGTSLVFALSTVLHWRTIALVNACCPIISTFLIFFIPESPIWLIANEKPDKAKKALCWLRGWVEPVAVEHEFLELIRYNERSANQTSKVDTDKKMCGDLFTTLDQFKDPAVYRPLKLVLIYFLFATVAGIRPCKPFIAHIMTDVGVSANPGIYLIFLAGMQSLGSVVLMLTVNRLGKRFLTLLTLSTNNTLLFALGVYIKAQKDNYITSTWWIPITIIGTIYFSGTCGIANIPWMLLGEVFPYRVRGIANGLCTGMLYLILFALAKSFLIIESILSLEYTMFLFSFVGIIGFIYLYFYLPETENKTLFEIEEHFSSNSKR